MVSINVVKVNGYDIISDCGKHGRHSRVNYRPSFEFSLCLLRTSSLVEHDKILHAHYITLKAWNMPMATLKCYLKDTIFVEYFYE